MKGVLFTLTGCTRCKIVKRFMEEREIFYEEKDIKAEGKEDFQKFYAANRESVYRGPQGIEFPVYFDGAVIRQGLGPVIAYLHSGKKLDGFFSIGMLHGEWVDGLHVSGGDPAFAGEFLEVLRYLKGNNMKLRVDTTGKNSGILRRILEEGLADLVVMEVAGPVDLYGQIMGETVDEQDIRESIILTSRFSDYRFQTTVAPLREQDGGVRYMTPEEVARAARLIEESTGSKKHPYLIRPYNPEKAADRRFKALKPMTPQEMFGYRTAAREYQVFAEIEKQ